MSAVATKNKPNVHPLHVGAIGLVLMAAIAAGYYFLIHAETETAITNTNTQISQQTTRVAELEDTRRNLLEIQSRADKLEKRLELLKGRLPDSREELNEFLSAISQRGSNAGLEEWVRIEPLEPLPDGEVQKVPIEMEFTATYDALSAFFWELSTMGEGVKTGGKEQIVNIRLVSIDRGKGTDGMVNVSCTAETYLYTGLPPEEEQGGNNRRRRRRR